jgi:branched-chain amino acid aminotransferase
MPPFAYFQKKFMPLEEAKIPIMTHALHYGTAVFEGIRGNWNERKKQLFVFRMKEHYERLHNGSRLLKMKLDLSPSELCRLTIELIRNSKLKEDIYIRPVVYKSSEALGVRLHNLDNDFLIFTVPWGRYLDMDTAKVCVSSWQRPTDNVIPSSGKINGIYVNNAFCKTEAQENGFDEGIMLTKDGNVSEGSGENIFLVINGKLVTPAISDNILIGITRQSVMKLARDELGIDTIERQIARSELYMADECFLTGTAAHLTPVSEIDRRQVGNGSIGSITAQLQQLYFEVIRGNNDKYLEWCTPVY